MLARASALLVIGAQADHLFTPTFDPVCARDSSVPASSFLEGSPIESEFMTILNGQMCSTTCPCPMEASTSYYAMPEEDLAYYGRSSANLVFSNSGHDFTTFSQCWNERLSQSGEYSDDVVVLMSDFLTSMEKMESEKACSGICDTGLFWFTKSVALEMPFDSCIMEIIDELSYEGQEVTEVSDLLVKLQQQ
jgi:hypothetical protein